MFLLIRECNHCIIMKMQSGGIDFGESETQAQIRRPQRRPAAALPQPDDEDHALHHASALRRVQQLPRRRWTWARSSSTCARKRAEGIGELHGDARAAGGLCASGFAASGSEPICFMGQKIYARNRCFEAMLCVKKEMKLEFARLGDFHDVPAGRDGGCRFTRRLKS